MYNKKPRQRVFRLGDLVLKQVFKNTLKIETEKLQANWEDPYIVMKVKSSRSYYIETMDETLLPQLWNIVNFKKYYQ